MSGDPEQEYFSDGISEDIITALSKLRWFFVIARNSSFMYKGKAVHVRQVGEDLGVGYVLEGSVRKHAGRVRITAQLNDVTNGSHVWAERYDRDVADIFADAVGKIFLLRIAAHVAEGEHGNGGTVGQWQYPSREFVDYIYRQIGLRCLVAGLRAHFPDEAHAFTRDRANQLLFPAAVADRPSRRVDAACQRRVRYDPSAPDGRNEIVLADDPIAILHQVDQQIEDLRLNLD